MKRSKLCSIFAAASLCVAGATLAADPRLPDGRPDFNGTWDNGGGIDFLQPQKLAGGSVCVTGCAPAPGAAAPGAAAPGAAAATAAPAGARAAPDRPKYRPEFQARVKALEANQVKTDPVLRCLPPGLPRIGPPDKIVQTQREIVFLYEDVSGPFFRIVPLDGRKRIDESETYLGDAHGRWEGDTLVVETGNFNEETWLTDDGSFHTTGLTVTERLRRNGDALEYTAVANDPKVLAEPWQLRPRRLVKAALEMAEPAPCIDQDLDKVVDGTSHDNPR
ncbi:MAG: hypothetical protein ABI859_09870 [Pseudomonadota bacterium]